MKKIVLLIFALILFSTAVVVRFINPVVSYPTEIELPMEVGLPVHNIDSGKNFSTIQEAINDDETLDGHTILVDAGIYYENVVINKTVSLIGKNRGTTIIDGNRSGVSVVIWSNNVIVSGFTIRNSSISYGASGVEIFSNSCVISNNIITNNQIGGILIVGHNNLVASNIISNNPQGIAISFTGESNNTICDNIIASNSYVGISIAYSDNNKIFHNNFVNNTNQVQVTVGSNTWDDGFPSGGNYWSDYTGVDYYSGAYQNETGSDGVGDAPYTVDVNNQDNYPLMGMFYDFAVEIEWGQICHVYVISNSTVSGFEGVCLWLTSANEYLQPGQPLIHLYVTGEEDSVGFCRIMIPRVAPLNNSYVVLVWSEYQLGHWKLVEIPSTELPTSNTNHAYIYFTYTHPLIFDEIIVTIPEFPTWTSILLTLIVLTVAVAIYKRRILK